VNSLRVALTTTGDRSRRLADHVKALGLEPVVLPCIELAPAAGAALASARSEGSGADWLVVTSPRTVEVLWPEGGMPSTNVAAVGEITAEAVHGAGGSVAVVGDGGAAELAERITRVVAGKSVFLPHAAGADRSTVDLLRRAGATVRAQVVYEIRPIAPGDDPVDSVVFGSASAVTGWFLSRDLEGLVVGVIGDTTAAALADHGWSFDVMPPRPSYGGLVRQLAEHLRDRSTV
jgi:uroporphyrinogen-III synthase